MRLFLSSKEGGFKWAKPRIAVLRKLGAKDAFGFAVVALGGLPDMAKATSALTCVDCADWFSYHSVQREKRLRYNHIASGEAYEQFKPKKQS